MFRALDRAFAGSGREVLVEGTEIRPPDISTIPDAVVTCAPIDLSTPVVAAEPATIVEIMSPPCEADDTGRKWLSYRQIPSLRHYLVVSQTERLVHIHSRAGDLWRERFVSAGAVDLGDPPAVLEPCWRSRRSMRRRTLRDRPYIDVGRRNLTVSF